MMIRLHIDAPKAATRTRPRKITGTAISMSAVRIRTSPSHPSRNAARKPQVTPTTIAIVVAAIATINDVRPPYINRTMTSRPFWSAPSRNLPCSPGPRGVPSGATTSVSCPSIITVSVM